jgi:hypothetical protein
MLQAEETLLAVRNNALWCDTICRSHGLPAEYDEHLWFVRGEAPRFYPNAVTLTEHGLAAQMAGLRELIDERPGGALAVKDSFRTLDLGSLGFRVLFEAEWIWRPAGRALPGAGIFGARWARVRDPAELANWEQAWAGDNAVGLPRLFMPALLADTTIAFLAAYHDSRIFAGAIANRTGDVVGISNVFAPANQGERIWGGCISAATQIFPGLPLVGYESGDDLGLAQAAGFETLAPLRVWVREAT